METHLYPDFLRDEVQYKRSEDYWAESWRRLDRIDREFYHWTSPWLGTGSPAIKDGNPIFSAYSPDLARGVRIVQQEPLDDRLDIQAYLDSFGGDFDDPDSIRELVIACALSEEAAKIALDLMGPWVGGGAVEFVHDKSGLLVPKNGENRMSHCRNFRYHDGVGG